MEIRALTLQEVLERRGYVVIGSIHDDRRPGEVLPEVFGLEEKIQGPIVITGRTDWEDLVEQNRMMGVSAIPRSDSRWTSFYRALAE